MKKNSYLFAFVASLFVLIGCSQDRDINGRSTLRLKLPESFTSGQGKVSAASSSACFAISIIGPNIDSTPATACDPAYGRFLGLVPAGETVVIEGLPKSDDHKIDIFYVTNTNGCLPRDPAKGLGKKPNLDTSGNNTGGFGANNVYRIARQALGQLRSGDNAVTVSVELPHPSNALSAIAELGIASSCNADPVVITQIQPPAGMVFGSKMLTAPSGKIMHIRLKDQRIEIKNPTNFNGRLAPHRLGEHQ